MRGWRKEPLVHFLLGGLLLYAFFAWRGEPVDPASRQITVSSQMVTGLSAGFEQQMGRAPTDAELDNLVERYVREEVLYREALRLGIDQDDAIIRRRLAQKMDLIAAAQADAEIPSENELQAWLEAHKPRFSNDSLYSFDQLWFAQKAASDEALKTIDGATNWKDLAKPIDLPVSPAQMPDREIAARFGQQFLRELEALEPAEQWQGPIPSGLGWHLVRLREVEAANVPPLSDIRDRVEQDWRSATAADRQEQAYQGLRETYMIEIER